MIHNVANVYPFYHQNGLEKRCYPYTLRRAIPTAPQMDAKRFPNQVGFR